MNDVATTLPVVLNEQEKINADHFGPFKVLADKIGHKYDEYWTNQDILTSKQIMRMLEVNLVADLLIAMLEGIKSKKQVKKYYDAYEATFDHDTDALEADFDRVIGAIAALYPEGLVDTEFRRPHLFYSLFTAVAHRERGVPNLPAELRDTGSSAQAARSKLERVDEVFAAEDPATLQSTVFEKIVSGLAQQAANLEASIAAFADSFTTSRS